MASEPEKAGKSIDKTKKLNQEQIIATFNKMRQDQKNLCQKVTEVEHELNEHTLVCDALKDCPPDRVCFRMIGGILVEKTVEAVLPAVASNQAQLAKLLEALNKQIEVKGKELNEFKDKYNIQIRKDPPISISEPTESTNEEPDKSSSSVLVKS